MYPSQPGEAEASIAPKPPPPAEDPTIPKRELVCSHRSAPKFARVHDHICQYKPHSSSRACVLACLTAKESRTHVHNMVTFILDNNPESGWFGHVPAFLVVPYSFTPMEWSQCRLCWDWISIHLQSLVLGCGPSVEQSRVDFCFTSGPH